MPKDKEQTLGTLAALAAYGLWGLLPVYWKLLSSVEPLQILAHRIVWALLFALVLLVATRKLPELVGLLRDWKRARYAMAASILVTLNWGTYIWAVNSGHVVESSLGYYINPLVSVALGAIFFRERLDKPTIAALCVASAGVVAATVISGQLPWISLVLAFSFGFYGLVKKKAGLPPLVGLAAETLFVSPLALAFLLARGAAGAGSFASGRPDISAFLAFAGVVTALPLLSFAAAANRITLTRLGFIQYLSPSLQLLLGLLAFGESVRLPMVVAFASVLVAVAIYVFPRGGNRPPAKAS